MLLQMEIVGGENDGGRRRRRRKLPSLLLWWDLGECRGTGSFKTRERMGDKILLTKVV